MRKIIFALLLGFAFYACDKEDHQAEDDELLIQAYLEAHPSINATRHSSGLYYEIKYDGKGNYPSKYSNVSVDYKGYLLENDSVMFDSGTYVGYLGYTIEGWQIGIPLLKPNGGRAKLIIPSGLAYGEKGAGTIPGNAVLIFDVTLNTVY